HSFLDAVNATATVPGAQPLTTLTVIATSIETITSCAASITNCPARTEELAALPTEALATTVVTRTAHLTTTVCPVAEASSISSSVFHQASSSGIKVTSTAVETLTTPKAVTITLGGNGNGNGNTRVITTTVMSTIENTVVKTITMTNA
ncbi:hypothetical protein OFM35_28545, partial [Escherichia coli]|nr:hypothetical protein [Escherichia coli]